MSEITRAELVEALKRSLIPGPTPLTVEIVHEAFVPGFTLLYDNQTEELEFDECMAWFKERGAKDMDFVEKALVSAFNFPPSHRRVTVTISNPVRPIVTSKGGEAYAPNI